MPDNCKCALKAHGALVPLDEARRFIRECMTAAGASENNAALMANLLAEADDRGHYSHGMNRLGFIPAPKGEMRNQKTLF